MNRPILENSMVLPSATPVEHDSDYTGPECAACHNAIDREDERVIEVSRSRRADGTRMPHSMTERYCHVGCLSMALYGNSDGPGRRELLKLVAALNLLAQIEPEKMPLLDQLDCDQARIREQHHPASWLHIDVSDLKEAAVNLLRSIGADSDASVEWTVLPVRLTDSLAEHLGKGAE